MSACFLVISIFGLKIQDLDRVCIRWKGLAGLHKGWSIRGFVNGCEGKWEGTSEDDCIGELEGGVLMIWLGV